MIEIKLENSEDRLLISISAIITVKLLKVKYSTGDKYIIEYSLNNGRVLTEYYNSKEEAESKFNDLKKR